MTRPRLHVSTLVILLLTAATIIGMNILTRLAVRPCPQSEIDQFWYGWPETFLYYGLPNNVIVPGANMDWNALLFNILIWLGILAAIAIPAEWIACSRWRPQLHLSTAVLTMLAAAALVWANTRSTQLDEQLAAVSASGKFILGETHGHGWPLTAVTIKHTLASTKTESIGENQFETLELQPNPPEIHWPQAAANTAIALLLLATLAFIIEHVLFRKKKPLPANEE